MQDKVPALSDSMGRMVTKGPWKLETKPHGHGDVHHLLQVSQLE
jgi:UDP-sugar pyrophosphorylase